MLLDEFKALEKSLEGAPAEVLKEERERSQGIPKPKMNFAAENAEDLELMQERVAEEAEKEKEKEKKAQADCKKPPAPPPVVEKLENPKTAPAQAEENCHEVICNVIQNSLHFVYIEGQFFQSNYDEDGKVDPSVTSGPIASMYDYDRVPNFKQWDEEYKGDLRKALEEGKIPDLKELNHAVFVRIQFTDPDFFSNLKRVAINRAVIRLSNRISHAKQDRVQNVVCQVLADRITKAILCDNSPYHAYIVMPIYPEGNLGDFALMTQVYYTMQTLFNGKDSLVSRVQRAILIKRLVSKPKNDPDRAKNLDAAKARVDEMDKYELEQEVPPEQWMEYLTILNLRNWTVLQDKGGPVTEQIYVHSKLVIADDMCAVLGSANINDRSLLGDRDSEIAVLIHDKTEGFKKPITGKEPIPVSKAVHELRVQLWEKLFALGTPDTPTIIKKTEQKEEAPSNAQKAVRGMLDKAPYSMPLPLIPAFLTLKAAQRLTQEMNKETKEVTPLTKDGGAAQGNGAAQEDVSTYWNDTVENKDKVADLSGWGYIKAATSLRAGLEKPADPETWQAINKVALKNLKEYTEAFHFTPRNDGVNSHCQSIEEPDEARTPKERALDNVKGKRGSSIWTTWWYENIFNHEKGEQRFWLPFEEEFWEDDDAREKRAKDEGAKVKVKRIDRPVPTRPTEVEGFIVAMPWLWTAGENNNSGLNLKIIAYLESLEDGTGTAMADAGKTGQDTERA